MSEVKVNPVNDLFPVLRYYVSRSIIALIAKLARAWVIFRPSICDLRNDQPRQHDRYVHCTVHNFKYVTY